MTTITSHILLDTCAAIWMTEHQPMTALSIAAIDDAQETSQTIYVSPITAWERGMLVSIGRISSPFPPKIWFDNLMALKAIKLAPLPVEVLTDSSFLPGAIHEDPADRIVIATARRYGYRIMTRDRKILEYAKIGHVNAIAC